MSAGQVSVKAAPTKITAKPSLTTARPRTLYALVI
jgi:hypothetical protein